MHRCGRFDAVIAAVRRGDAAPYLPPDENAGEAAACHCSAVYRGGGADRSASGNSITTARNGH